MAKEKTAYQRWYERNKDSVNEARRKKYKSDAEYREEVKRSSSASYRSKPFVSKSGQTKEKPVVSGGTVVSYSISEAAEMVGRSISTIRLWESRGWIPAPTIVSLQRFYTDVQINLMRELLPVVSHYRLDRSPNKEAVLSAAVESVKSRWAIT